MQEGGLGTVQIVLCSADVHFSNTKARSLRRYRLTNPKSGLPIEPGTAPRNLDALVVRHLHAVGLHVKERPSHGPILDRPGMQGFRAASLPLGLALCSLSM